MEMTPQQIDAARTKAEINRQVTRCFSPEYFAHMEKVALEQHPPVFRTTVAVPTELRVIPPPPAKPKRQPKIKQHVLP